MQTDWKNNFKSSTIKYNIQSMSVYIKEKTLYLH